MKSQPLSKVLVLTIQVTDCSGKNTHVQLFGPYQLGATF